MKINNKGFTLVEVLAVIVILSILSILVVVNVIGIKKGEDEENDKNVISSILAGAKRYVADNPNVIDGTEAEINVNDLVNRNYVDFDSSQKEFLDKKVKINICPDNNLKLKYVFEGYNDCGCDNQNSDVKETLCKNNKEAD